MIFRHFTTEEKMPEILNSGYLKTEKKEYKKDYGCVSLEEYKGNDIILECFANQQSNKSKNFVPLFFDGEKLFEAGKNFKEIILSKAENKVFICNGVITQAEYDLIGEYYFHIGNLSLDYLTEETKERIGY